MPAVICSSGVRCTSTYYPAKAGRAKPLNSMRPNETLRYVTIRLFGIKEAAAELAPLFTEAWLRGHIKEIPHIRVGNGRGGRIGFTEAHLEEIVAMFEVRPEPARFESGIVQINKNTFLYPDGVITRRPRRWPVDPPAGRPWPR
jgi:hypothetical protein